MIGQAHHKRLTIGASDNCDLPMHWIYMHACDQGWRGNEARWRKSTHAESPIWPAITYETGHHYTLSESENVSGPNHNDAPLAVKCYCVCFRRTGPGRQDRDETALSELLVESSVP
jgi:hypothetical protein